MKGSSCVSSNITFRAFRLDTYVPPINWEIAEDLGWSVDPSSGPILIARYQRLLLDSSAKGILRVRTSIARFLRRFANGPYEVILDDTTSAEIIQNDLNRKETKKSTKVHEAKQRFFRALRQTFSNTFVEEKVNGSLRELRG